MHALVHSDALHFEKPVSSYWEATAAPLDLPLQALAADTRCDVAIVGGGISGLSAALELAAAGVDVCLLEAGPLGWGASGRNGGFACIGSHKLPYATMIRRHGLEQTQQFYSAMRDSVDLVADTASRHNMDIWKQGAGEVTLAHRPGKLAELAEDRAFYKATFGEDNDLLQQEDLKALGLHGPHFHGGLRGKIGFGIHPLNYVRGLARAAHGAGARLCPHSKLIRWQQEDGLHHLHTDHAKVSARRVIIATNGYTPENISHHHKGRLLPALSNIIVTRPLTGQERADQGWTSNVMAYDSRHLLHYFRLLPDGRFLFGGRGGTDSSAGAAPHYQRLLTQTFHRLFPAWQQAEITHFWRGHVCLAHDRVPYLGPLDEAKTVWTSLAYHGNGVAMASWCGQALARVLAGRQQLSGLPGVITRRLAKFPFPAFRPLYLKGAYLWYGLQDGR